MRSQASVLFTIELYFNDLGGGIDEKGEVERAPIDPSDGGATPWWRQVKWEYKK